MPTAHGPATLYMTISLAPDSQARQGRGPDLAAVKPHYPRTGAFWSCPGLLLDLDHFLTFPLAIASPCSIHLCRRTRLTDPDCLDCLPYLRRPILKPMAHGPWPIAHCAHTYPYHTSTHTHAYPCPSTPIPRLALFHTLPIPSRYNVSPSTSTLHHPPHFPC